MSSLPIFTTSIIPSSLHSKPRSRGRATKITIPMAATTTDMGSNNHEPYDRIKEVKTFDDSKMGVKGLMESGITSLPQFFIHPPETLKELASSHLNRPDPKIIPTVDLSGAGSDRRAAIVEQVSRASRELGFFQIVNHGIPLEVIDSMIGSIKGFHEQSQEVKAEVYRRDMGTGVSFISNIDLFHSKAASWRDTLQVKLGPQPADAEQIPQICRNEVLQWNTYAKQVAELLMELLCEGLGLEPQTLKEMMFSEGRVMVGHYYPPCPQPDLTFGITSHSDPGVLTLLLQDHIGGLQIKHGNDWIDVKPVRGALVINIGDILQIISNGEYRSVEHRVLANPCNEPRISIAVFFNTSNRDGWLGPFPQIITQEKPAIYRQFVVSDYLTRFFTKELYGKTLTDFYKL